MGPYYRGTSQGMGAFIEMFYEHPELMLLLSAAVVGGAIYLFRSKMNSAQGNDVNR